MKKIISLILIISFLIIPNVYAEDVKFTRGSFCKKIVEAIGVEVDYSETEFDFYDIDKENEYYDYIMFMTELGFISGYEDGTFGPEKNVTRAEVAAVTVRMLFGENFDIPDNAEYDLDYNSNTWYAKYAWKAKSCGLMNSENNLFKGNYTATEKDINYNVMKSIISEATVSSDNISLDLSQGSIVIDNGTVISYLSGANEYTQDGNTINTSGKCIIRQSDLSGPTVNTITVSAKEANVTIANINISSKTSPIKIEEGSKLNLTLLGDNTLVATGDSYAGIRVEDNSTIVIGGTGKITATGGEYGAGIGGGYGGNGGNITINGGAVSAIGGNLGGAGIGGGYGGNGENITINGGEINATGGTFGGAGIGGGSGGYGGNVKISNANVTAWGDDNAIGGGSTFNLLGCNSIEILNATTDLSYNMSNSMSRGNKCQERIYDTSFEHNSHAALNGNTISITTDAYGNSGLSYRWWKSINNSFWTVVEGETSSTLNIKMTDDNDGHYYMCELTNGWGNVVDTDVVQCFVLGFVKQPQNATVNVGDVHILEAESSCSNVTYQWERSFDGGESYSKLDNEIYSTLIINADPSLNDALYRCVITADNGDSLASDAAKISVVSTDVYYTERFYLQNANDDNYTAVEQNSVLSTAGTSVTVTSKFYAGFVENTSLGVHSGTVAEDNSLVLSRYYDRKVYAITFNTNGGVVLPKLRAKQGAYITLPTPSRYGYSFEGWFTDSDLTNKADISTMPMNGAILYAKWNSPDNSSRGKEYKINAITLRSTSNYEEIVSIPQSDFIAEISVTNISSVHTDTIIIATYDKYGVLIDMTYMYASVDTGKTVALGTLIKNNNGNISKVKAFIWPTLNNPKPLAYGVEIGE